MTAAMTEKEHWQEVSLLDMVAGQEDDFLQVIDDVPAGRVFSVNHVRERLDARAVPESKRAALFARACKAGLIVPVTALVKGIGSVPVTEQSTGRSAHRAQVRIYQRTDVNLVGAAR